LRIVLTSLDDFLVYPTINLPRKLSKVGSSTKLEILFNFLFLRIKLTEQRKAYVFHVQDCKTDVQILFSIHLYLYPMKFRLYDSKSMGMDYFQLLSNKIFSIYLLKLETKLYTTNVEKSKLPLVLYVKSVYSKIF